MHIALDATPSIHDVSAIRRYCFHLVRELTEVDADNTYSLLFLGCRSGGGIGAPPQGPNIRLCKSTIPGRVLNPMWRFFGAPLLETWVKPNPDILHFPGGYPYIPNSVSHVLTTLHGFAHHHIAEYLPADAVSRASRRLEKTLAASTAFITVSAANKLELQDIYGIHSAKISVVPLGISPEFVVRKPQPKVDYGLRRKYDIPNKNLMLYVGAVAPHKNVRTLIRAFAELSLGKKNSWHLVLVGAIAPAERGIGDLISELKIPDNVTLIDYIPPGSQELAVLYNLAGVFVTASFYEGWASPPLEAMACGTPAIVSDIPSLRESTGGHALYADPNDPIAIRDKMVEVINDNGLRRKLIEDGLTFAMRYTWRRCAEETLAVYRNIIVGL